MSEIRKHYFLSEYCIIAEERAKRPSDFAVADKDHRKNDSETCPAEVPRKTLRLLLLYIKVGKSIPITLKKGYATGIFAAFRIFILPFRQLRNLRRSRKMVKKSNLDMVFMKSS